MRMIKSYIAENHAHDHPPETAQITVAKVVEKMKQRAKNETTIINCLTIILILCKKNSSRRNGIRQNGSKPKGPHAMSIRHAPLVGFVGKCKQANDFQWCYHAYGHCYQFRIRPICKSRLAWSFTWLLMLNCTLLLFFLEQCLFNIALFPWTW